jgi:predicted esterase
MQQHSITVPKTARYFQLGEITTSTKQIWIVLHGYGQLANYFIKWFEPIVDSETVIIAPEGLHRFYWQGFSGKVVASWMTKEDRENDIKDYINFLDEVMDIVKAQVVNSSTKVIAFGFSQGVATVSRWVFNTKGHHPDELVLWAGLFPSDFALENKWYISAKKTNLCVVW